MENTEYPNALVVSEVSQQVAEAGPDADADPSQCRQGRASPRCDGERIGKVVYVKDIAYVTSVLLNCVLKLFCTNRAVPHSWRAMIFYLFTSQISFAPLSFSLRSRARSAKERERCIPPKPSAKSMYRLADKVDLISLSIYQFHIWIE
jgi:hypothetical protein